MPRFLLLCSSVLLLASCGDNRDAAAAPQAPADPAPAAVSLAAPDTGLAPATAAAAVDTADPRLMNGRRQFRRCQSCHTVDPGGRHTVGPNLYGIAGRPAASATGFGYSTAMRESGLVWDVETLDAWLTDPRGLVPGNRMSFVGLRDVEARQDVILYLQSLDDAAD